MLGDIGEKKKEPLKKLTTLTILTLGVMAMLLGVVGCAMSPNELSSPTPNVQFDRANANWTQEEVTNRLRLALSQLTSQSQSLLTQYAERVTELRREIRPGGDNSEIFAKIDFSSFVQDLQYEIQRDYRRRSAYRVKYHVAARLESLVSEIQSLLEPQAAELFEARLTAFQILLYIEQREFLESAERAARESEFAEAAEVIARLSGFRLPTNLNFSTITVSLRTLRNVLERDLPDITGSRELRGGLLQQFEDFAQFDAWTADLSLLRFDLTLPRTYQQKPR